MFFSTKFIENSYQFLKFFYLSNLSCTMSNFFFQFGVCNVSCLVNDFWRAIWVGVVSEIWKHRNNVIFKKGKVDVSEVFAMIQVNVWSCIYSKTRGSLFSYSNWCLDLLACMRLVCWCFCCHFVFLCIFDFVCLVGVSWEVRGD